MKKQLFTGAMTVALVLGASPVFAADVSVGAGAGISNPVKDLRASLHADVMVKKEDRLDTMLQNRVEIDAKRGEMTTYLQGEEQKIKDAKTPEERQALVSELRATLSSYQSDMKQTRTDDRAEVKAKTADLRATRAMNITKVYSAMIDRLTLLATRIASRIEKVSAMNSGKDVTLAQTALVNANVKITLSAEALAKLPAYTDAAYKDAVNAVKTDLKDAQQALVDAVTILKGNSIQTSTTASASTSAQVH